MSGEKNNMNERLELDFGRFITLMRIKYNLKTKSLHIYLIKFLLSKVAEDDLFMDNIEFTM